MRLSYYIKNFNELSKNKVGIVNINIKDNLTTERIPLFSISEVNLYKS